MKIILFDFATLNFGGGCEKNFMKMGKWFKERGHEVIFLTGSNRINNQYCSLVKIGKHKKNIDDFELKKKFGVDKYYTFDIRDLIFSTKNRINIRKILNKSDVIYSKNEIFEIIILGFIFRINPKKIIYGIHTPTYYPITRSFMSKSHNLLYNSRFYTWLIKKSKCRTLTQYQKYLLEGFNKDINVMVIPNPLDTKKFYQKEYVKKNKFKIYYIGRMTEQKGIDTLYDTIILLSKKKIFNNLEFFFVGNGDQENLLIKLNKKFHNCHFLGFQSEVLKFYHDADITIAPSRWEGMPYSILEAQSCGTPVVTTNSPGCKDIIFHNKNGWISEIDDVEEISRNIIKAYFLWKNNFEKFKKIGLFARNNVVENYDEDFINKKIEEFMVRKNE